MSLNRNEARGISRSCMFDIAGKRSRHLLDEESEGVRPSLTLLRRFVFSHDIVVGLTIVLSLA